MADRRATIAPWPRGARRVSPDDHYPEVPRTAWHSVHVAQVGIHEFPELRTMDFHPLPERRLIIHVRGEVEIGVSDGSTQIFRPGDARVMEDTSGRGHTHRDLSPGIQAVVVLKDERSAGPLFCDVRIYLTRRYSQREPLRSRHGKASHTGSVPGPSAHHHSLTVLL